MKEESVMILLLILLVILIVILIRMSVTVMAGAIVTVGLIAVLLIRGIRRR